MEDHIDYIITGLKVMSDIELLKRIFNRINLLLGKVKMQILKHKINM